MTFWNKGSYMVKILKFHIKMTRIFTMSKKIPFSFIKNVTHEVTQFIIAFHITVIRW